MNGKQSKIRFIKNKRGQIAVEMILLLAIGVSLALTAVNFLKGNEFIQKLAGRPWNTLSGMIECGTWNGCQKGFHPGASSRGLSLKPEEN